jgi:23S rRNA pseudouridine1911/1915/1917 synthase
MIESIRDHILYNNQQLIAANKPAGIGALPDKTGDKSLQDLLEIYCKHKLFPVHRIDRPVSGVILYAKNKKAVAALHKQFADRKVKKTYYAIVRQKPESDSATLKTSLQFDKRYNKSKSSDVDTAKEAVMHYTYLGSSDNYHLLKITPLTGRQHQIRAQLASIGCTIKGDVKYGDKRGNKDRSIQLHAAELQFFHPVTAHLEQIVAPTPDLPVWNAFLNLINHE